MNPETTFIVLGRLPNGNAYHAVVEHSFSMDLHDSRACLFWSGNAVGQPIPLRVELKGYQNADFYRQHFSETRPDMKFEVWALSDEDIPVVVDVDALLAACADRADTLSGVRDKFAARNAPFEMR